jgi:hypothetical protein
MPGECDIYDNEDEYDNSNDDDKSYDIIDDNDFWKNPNDDDDDDVSITSSEADDSDSSYPPSEEEKEADDDDDDDDDISCYPGLRKSDDDDDSQDYYRPCNCKGNQFSQGNSNSAEEMVTFLSLLQRSIINLKGGGLIVIDVSGTSSGTKQHMWDNVEHKESLDGIDILGSFYHPSVYGWRPTGPNPRACDRQAKKLSEAIRNNEYLRRVRGHVDESQNGELYERLSADPRLINVGGSEKRKLRQLVRRKVRRENKRREKQWNAMYDELRKYKKENGNTNVPPKHEQNGLKLGVWVDTQRQRRKKGILVEERVTKLDELGFQWDPQEGGC